MLKASGMTMRATPMTAAMYNGQGRRTGPPDGTEPAVLSWGPAAVATGSLVISSFLSEVIAQVDSSQVVFHTNAMEIL
jgi:hypothetical protein